MWLSLWVLQQIYMIFVLGPSEVSLKRAVWRVLYATVHVQYALPSYICQY